MWCFEQDQTGCFLSLTALSSVPSQQKETGRFDSHIIAQTIIKWSVANHILSKPLQFIGVLWLETMDSVLLSINLKIEDHLKSIPNDYHTENNWNNGNIKCMIF